MDFLISGHPPSSAQADELQRFAESHDGIALLRAASRIEDRKVRKQIISAVESLSHGRAQGDTDALQFTAQLDHGCHSMNAPEKDAEAVRAIQAMKRDLAGLISQALRARRIRQKNAAKLLNTNQPRISAMANRDSRLMSLERLLRYALILNWTAELRFIPSTESSATARLKP